jgi:predicted SprT family Zn-dependent metalloprotease
MSDFKITEDKIPTIAEGFKVEHDKVVDFLTSFREFYETVRQQHLASVVRALELYVRKKFQRPQFKIVWRERSNEARSVSAVGLQWDYKYGIVIPPELAQDLQMLRVHVAHELGHLFYAITHPENKGNRDLNQKMAHVFGTFTMMERSDFYIEKAPKMCHTLWTQIISDFNQLNNREAGKLGIS